MNRTLASALGKQLGLGLIKQAQIHPLEEQRRNAQYALGQRSLLGEMGYGQGPDDQMRALTESDEYYNRVRKLYDQIFNTVSRTPSTASEKETSVLSVPQ